MERKKVTDLSSLTKENTHTRKYVKREENISEEQYNILVNFMESHGNLSLPSWHVQPVTARVKDVCSLWDQLTNELNQAGEPLTTSEWAGVWRRLKYSLRNSLRIYQSKGQLESFPWTPLQKKIIKSMGGEENLENILVQAKAGKGKKPASKPVSKSAKTYYSILYRANKAKSRTRLLQAGEKREIQLEIHESWKNMPEQMKQCVILKHKREKDLKFLRIADGLKDVDLNQLPVKLQCNPYENNEDNTHEGDVGTLHDDSCDTDNPEEANTKQIDDSTYVNTCENNEDNTHEGDVGTLHDDVFNTDKPEEAHAKQIDDATNYLMSDDFEDSTRVIAIMDAPVEDISRMSDDFEDSTRVIEIMDAPVEDISRMSDDFEDSTRVIAIMDAPVEDISRMSDDFEDSTRVIAIMDAPVEDISSSRSDPRPNEVAPPPPPAPPVVTTAEELYDMLQKSRETEPKSWISLPEVEKRQFRAAINSLKKEHLRQYRTYLHNLSSAHLHQHMVQTLFYDII